MNNQRGQEPKGSGTQQAPHGQPKTASERERQNAQVKAAAQEEARRKRAARKKAFEDARKRLKDTITLPFRKAQPSWVEAISMVALAFFTIINICLTHDLVNATNGQTTAVNTNFGNDERPILVANIRIDPPKGAGRFTVTIWPVNYGRSPAKHVVIKMAIGAFPSPNPTLENARVKTVWGYVISAKPWGRAVSPPHLKPGEPGLPSDIDWSKPLDAPTVTNVLRGHHSLIVGGTLSYDDYFEHPFSAEFCYELDAGITTYCPTHNE